MAKKFEGVYVSTEMVKGIVRVIGVRGLAIALNNAFCHGDILEEVYGECRQEDLDTIFAGIELFEKAADSLEEAGYEVMRP